jgi:spore coat protein CotF
MIILQSYGMSKPLLVILQPLRKMMFDCCLTSTPVCRQVINSQLNELVSTYMDRAKVTSVI